MTREELLEMVRDKFQNDPELKKYVEKLDTVRLSNATLYNFLTLGNDYVKRYFGVA